MNRVKMKAYAQLMRLDKPIGTLLLLWPTLWALLLAAQGMPHFHVLIVFVLGVILMRAAGCVINDFADRRVDGHVKRTQNRPMPSGLISEKEALRLFVILIALAAGLVLTLNSLTIYLSFAALGLAFIYPFMKRITHLPQLVLGAAFSWAIPMAYAAQSNQVPMIAWLMFAANLCWTVAYDTLYAMVDRDDDLKIGVKSTAILFGRYDKIMIGLLQLTTILLLILIGYICALTSIYYVSILIAAILFVYQQWLSRARVREACFQAFLNNHYVGLVIFLGISGSLLI